MRQKSKTLEEKIYLTWYEDGLIDIYTGIVLLAIGIQMMYPNPYIMIIGIIGAFLWVKVAKKSTDARLGKVTFSKQRQQAIEKLNRVLVTFMAASVVIGLALFLLQGQAVDQEGARGWPRGLPLGVIMIVGMGIVARMVPLQKFAVYALLFAGLMAADILTNLPLFYAFIVGGMIIIFMGLGDYSRFKEKYPLKTGADDA